MINFSNWEFERITYGSYYITKSTVETKPSFTGGVEIKAEVKKLFKLYRNGSQVPIMESENLCILLKLAESLESRTENLITKFKDKSKKSTHKKQLLSKPTLM